MKSSSSELKASGSSSTQDLKEPGTNVPLVEGPARITSSHRRYALTKEINGPMGFENEDESPLHKAWCSGKIDDQEHVAGRVYRSHYEQMGRSGKDSTQFTIVGGSSGVPFTQSQVDAIRAVEAMERYLEGKWRMVVRKFCGEGYTASEAIRAAGEKNPREVWPQMRLALSKLATAIVKSKVSHETSSDY